MEMIAGNNLRSTASIHHSFAIFANGTRRIVDVYWVDYEGKLVHYMKLKPNNRTMVNTYSTHPWLFLDTETGERMHVENSEVFWPKPSLDIAHLQLQGHRPQIRRAEVVIHFPLRTLREIGMWCAVKDIARNVRDIHQWEIPKTLKLDVVDLFMVHLKHKEAMEARNQFRLGS